MILSVAAWRYREGLLQKAADAWVVSDPITSADVVAVLGGGYDVRPVIAAELFAKRLVHKVLLSQTDSDQTALNLKILRDLHVPEGAIELFGSGSKNTHEEAVALKSWATGHHVSAVIVPTEVFFARRARWVFRRVFFGTGIRIEVPSFEPPHGYSKAGWWRTGGWRTFPTEVIKYFFYLLRFG